MIFTAFLAVILAEGIGWINGMAEKRNGLLALALPLSLVSSVEERKTNQHYTHTHNEKKIVV